MSQNNAFVDAKTEAVSACVEAEARIGQLRKFVETTTSPSQSEKLRGLCADLRTSCTNVSEKCRYLHQVASHTWADPVRGAILRSDISIINSALMAEVFEECEIENSDPEVEELLRDLWPEFCRRHGVATPPAPPSLNTIGWLRLRDEWVQMAVEHFRVYAEGWIDELASERARVRELEMLAIKQGSRIVRYKGFDESVDYEKKQLFIMETRIRNAIGRIATVDKASADALRARL